MPGHNETQPWFPVSLRTNFNVQLLVFKAQNNGLALSFSTVQYSTVCAKSITKIPCCRFAQWTQRQREDVTTQLSVIYPKSERFTSRDFKKPLDIFYTLVSSKFSSFYLLYVISFLFFFYKLISSIL